MPRLRTTGLIVILSVALTAVAARAWQARGAGVAEGVVVAGSSVVRGAVVTDTADPQPVRRATVRLTGAGATSRIVGTDDDGRFTFDRLPAGRFTLSAMKAGFVTTFHGSTLPGRGPGAPVAVADGQTVDVVIRLVPGAVVTGRITDERGSPAVGVGVSVVDARTPTGPARVPARTVTDDRGAYRVFGLAPGDYLVSATPRLEAAPIARGGSNGSAVIAVNDADVQRARAAGVAPTVGTAPGGAVRGGPATAGRSVAYAPVFYPGTVDVAATSAIRVAKGEERTGVDMSLRLVTLARLAGVLADADGRPIASAQVTLVPKRGDSPTFTDALLSSGTITMPRALVADSRFTFSGVAPGQYTLVARTGSGQRGTVATAAAAPTAWSVVDVTVDGSDREDVALRLLPGLTVSGRYVFERSGTTASDPAQLNMSFIAIDPIPGVATTYRSTLQADGTFRVQSLAPSHYVARADATSASGSRWFLRSAVVSGRDVADNPFAANADGTELSGVIVTFSDRMASVTGRLIDSAGRPVTRYSVVVVAKDSTFWFPKSRRIRAMQPATDGSFSMGGLPSGDYVIAAVVDLEDADLTNPSFLSDLLGSGLNLTLADGEARRQDLRVRE